MRNDDQLLNAAETKRFLGGVSDMWLHRRLRDDPTFPSPRYVNHLRFWLKSELLAWIGELPRENLVGTTLQARRARKLAGCDGDLPVKPGH
jgi:predicted DNA-binding transcriptional regulator AlpA